MPASLGGEMEGMFPSFIPKTDETRVQVLQGLLDKYQNQKFYVTEKLDGASATYFVRDGVFGVCSRNFQLKETENNTFWEVARNENIEEKLRSLEGNWAIQGELVGEGIQKNKCGIKGHTLFVFNVFNIDNYKFLNLEDLEKTLEKIDIKCVPVLERDFVMTNHIPTLVQKAIGASIFNHKMPREGLVFRPMQEAREMRSGRVSFKAINPEFLLKFE
jgi:RNA ligase (TIGR02306 family)